MQTTWREKEKEKDIKEENQQRAIYQMLINYVILSPKENELLLNSRKRVKWAIVSLLGFQYLLYLLDLWRIYCLISIG